MKRVLFVIGGRSGEHEISLISAKYVLQNLDARKYSPLVVVIQKSGAMTYVEPSVLAQISNNPLEVKTPQGVLVEIRPYSAQGLKPCLVIEGQRKEFDVAFPLLHGPGGEDGTVQGMFEFAGIPVVGCGVKASALCMDKAMTKRICRDHHLPVVPFVEVYRGGSIPQLPWGFPVFVKPAHLGSSLGVTKVKSASDLKAAVESALLMDVKAMIEPAIVGREIEVAVYGKRGQLTASPLGEIKCKTEFYSYEAKYIHADAAELLLPAPVTADESVRAQMLAKAVFEALDCSGMARVDFFLTPQGELFLNEVNTIPGFTPISMYPKMMNLAGIGYSELISGLIDLA
jgi:D-alanine-D-alanine ligase